MKETFSRKTKMNVYESMKDSASESLKSDNCEILERRQPNVVHIITCA